MKKRVTAWITVLVMLTVSLGAAIAQETQSANLDDENLWLAETGDAESQLSAGQLQQGKMYFFSEGVDGDYIKAAAWFRKAAELGNAEAQYYLGLICENAVTFLGQEDNDYEQAAAWYRKAAEQGYEKAQLNLGYLYADERFEKCDYAEAAVWFGLAAAQGNVLAQYTLGYMYSIGCGVKQDVGQGRQWYLLAAEQGFVYAQSALGDMYDAQRGMSWLEIAANQGEFWAQYCLGETYDGIDDEKAIYWFARSAAQGHYTAWCRYMADFDEYYGLSQDELLAVLKVLNELENPEQAQGDLRQEDVGRDAILQNAQIVALLLGIEAELGDSDSQTFLGVMYEFGLGVAQDHAKAMEWYQKAAERGNADAIRGIGRMYQYGKGVAQDDALALKWYRKAADGDIDRWENDIPGDLDAMEAFAALSAHIMGQDDMPAAVWCRQAAEQGDIAAMRYLAAMYDDGGCGVERDSAQALEWLRMAAVQGDAAAQYALGNYLYKYGVEEDPAQAIAWYIEAAEQGNTAAMRALGSLYEFKQDTKDDTKAFQWYQKAAVSGDPKAQCCLGSMYQYGKGVPKDFARAMECYRKAEEQRDAVARYEIGHMYRYGMGVEQDLLQAIAWYASTSVNDDSSRNELHGLLEVDFEPSE